MSELDTAGAIDWFMVIIGLAGGLAIFLIGLNYLTEGLQHTVGDGMRDALYRLTSNRFTAVLSGMIVTTMTQSSTVTTVLLVGLVSAQLVTLTQSIGVILGADIASTFTAQIMAFKITRYSLLFVAVGFAMTLASRRHRRVRSVGQVVLATGMIFFGMSIMGEATDPLRTWSPFIEAMKSMRNPWLGMLVGMVFTAVIQSSGATTGLLIVLAASGLITLEAGIAVALGANIGTCVTAILAAIGKPRAAFKVAAAHTLIKVIGVAIWIPLIPYLADFVRWISPSYPELESAARLARETPRQIANAHTAFNVANALLFIGFVTPLARLLERALPDREELPETAIRAKYLDDTVLKTPSLAMERIHLETKRLGGYVMRDLDRAFVAILSGSSDELDELSKDVGVHSLHDQILVYMRKAGRLELSRTQSRQLENLLLITDCLASMHDIAQTNMVNTGRERLRARVVFSDEARRRIMTLFDRSKESVQLAVSAVEHEDKRAAWRVIDHEPEIEEAYSEAMDHLSSRLFTDLPKRTETFRIESECIAQARRLQHYAKRIARIVIAGLEHEEREVKAT